MKGLISLKHSGTQIKIILRERRLYFYQNSLLYGSYPIAIGKARTPSPIGIWTIVNKAFLDGRKVYGTRWMGLSKDRYGIHGTNNPSCIGKAVSLGCIRMYNKDIESIFPLVSIGTPVEIVSGTQESGYPLPPYPTSSFLKENSHIVRQGDSLWQIAKSYNLSLQTLIQLNPNLNPDLIYPGQTIRLK